METNHNMRKTGIDVIGVVPWGTHFCQFYETKQDLLDVLIPYFRAGLENNELCVWVTSEFLTTDEAKLAMQKSVPGFSKYLKTGQIEIFPHTEWYLKGGIFEMKRVLADWVRKHDRALKNGFAGTRVSGNPFWIDNKKDWNDFAAYEAEINKVIDKYKLVVLCTYSLKKCSTSEVIDVISNHEFALIKQRGRWATIESSAHHKMEEALRRSESRYRSYVELTDQLAWTTNVKGEVEEDIPSWRKFTGQSYEEVKGAGWSKALHPDDIKRTFKVWHKALATKHPYEIEYRVRRFDGVYRHFLVRGVPVFKKNGSILGWVGTCIDITGRKKAEEVLKEHTVQLEKLNRSLQETLVKEDAVFESIGDGIIHIDKKGTIIALNKKAEYIFGWGKGKLLGKPFFSQFKLENEEGRIVPRQLRPPQLSMTTAKVVRGIYFLIKEDLKKFPISITSAPVILNNEVIGAVTVYRDIGQQVAISKAKDEFLSFVSHSLRTPLSAIAWSIERMNEERTGYSSEQIKCLDQINSQTQKMIQLTNDFLDATKMGLEVFSYNKIGKEINLEDIASDVIKDFKNRIKDKKIKFRSDFDKSIGTYKTYSNAIYLILHNLLSNAVKFTPTGGRVNLRIARIKEKAERQILLQVSDSGMGIPKSARTKIFQKMYRADNVKHKFEGSGLGLYITSGIIDYMDGKISVESAPNKGTTFTVFLPLNPETSQVKERGQQ